MNSPIAPKKNIANKINTLSLNLQRLWLVSSLLLIAFCFCLMTANAALSKLSDDQRSVLKEISKQMNENKALSGEFIQTGPNGQTTKGTFYLKRPGQMRFKYKEPSAIDIISDGKSVAVINKQLETQDLLPLKKTPLRYLLRRKLNLNKIDSIKNVGLLGNNIVVIIEDPEAFNESRLRLFFNKDNYNLEQWIVTDAQGLDTSVELIGVKPDKNINENLFKISYP